MELFNPKKTKKNGPEAAIQKAVKAMLEARDWGVKETHGNLYQFGFPDLYIFHSRFGTRWVEIKNPLAYSFTQAQLETFPFFSSKGVGIWIITAATEEQYKLLFQPPNWYTFLSIMR